MPQSTPSRTAHNLLQLGLTCQQQHKISQAIRFYRQALRLNPQLLPAYNNLATITGEKSPKQAVKLLHQALAIDPRYFPAYCNLGNMYRLLGDIPQAKHAYHQAIVIKPDLTEAHLNLAQLALTTDDHLQAIPAYEAVLKHDPQNLTALINLTTTYRKLDQTEKSLKLIHRIYEQDSSNAKASYQHSLILAKQKKFAEAIAVLKTSLSVHPNDGAITAYLHYLYTITCDFPNLASITPLLTAQTRLYIENGQQTRESPGQSLSTYPDPAQHLAVAQSWSHNLDLKTAPFRPRFTSSPFTITPRLKIGYLSSDFTNHATTHLMLKLLKLHRRPQFHITALSYSPPAPNRHRQEVEKSVDTFIDLHTANSLEAAQIIHQQHINILIELKGHTQDSRLEIAALKPAPIQLTWLGFPGTTGTDFIDYFVGDPVASPLTFSPYFSESFLTLPHTYQVNSFVTPAGNPKQEFLPKLPPHAFCFGCFNQSYKITPPILNLWFKLLHQLPYSAIWLYQSNPLATTQLKSAARDTGIDPSRLMFTPQINYRHHLARFKLAQLCLDPTPINGHTTTSESLWAGIPVLVLLGNTFASRVSASLLTALGLSELITHSLDDYYHLALYLATHPEKLKIIKRKLNTNRPSYPLFDTDRFTRNLETAYLTVWDNYLQGRSPRPFNITDPHPLNSQLIGTKKV